MPTYYTLTEAAAKLGCHKSQTSRHARKLGLGKRLGTAIVLTPRELSQLKKSLAEAESNRRKSLIGNDFWRYRQVSKKTS